MSNKTSAQSSRASSPIIDGGIRKRVGKACDRCRMKKSKCDGSTPCSKCKADNAICAYGRRKRSAQDRIYPRGYVELLEHQQSQLVNGLQELYRRAVQHGQDWVGELLPEMSHEKVPMTHDLLAWLGALRPDEHNVPDKFYDDFYMMQAVSILGDDGSTKRGASFDSVNTLSEAAQTPTFEAVSAKTLHSTNPSPSCYSPTQYTESPRSSTTKPSSPLPDLTRTDPTQTFSQVSWVSEPTDLQPTDFNILDPWMYEPSAQAIYATQANMFQQPAQMSINPYLTLRDWSLLDAYQQADNGVLYT